MRNLRQGLRSQRRRKRLRRDLRQWLAAAQIQSPSPMAEICKRLGEHRRRPIHLIPQVMDVPGPFGLWIKTSQADVIIYQCAGTTPLHREHIIAHELGHLLADHPSDEDDEAALHALMPDIPPDVVRRALRRRTSYDTEFEREAEILATVLLETTLRTRLVAQPGQSPRARRAQTTLGDPVDLR